MNVESKNLFEYYRGQSSYSDPKSFGYLFDDLPDSISEIVRIVQNILIDRDLLGLYGKEISDEQKNDSNVRYVEKILLMVAARDNRVLTDNRVPEKKFVGSCRDFAIVFCSVLRYKGVPARVRCGFDVYFNIESGFHDDHWMCEYWSDNEQRWILVDVNVDKIVKEEYQITVNTIDVPRDKFITAGEAWRMCRNSKVDSNKFGVSLADIKGLWFVLGSVLRDLAALNKVEVLPWDYQGLSDKDFNMLGEEELNLVDRVVALIADSDNTCFQEIRQLYENDKRLKAPTEIKSYIDIDQYQMVKIY